VKFFADLSDAFNRVALPYPLCFDELPFFPFFEEHSPSFLDPPLSLRCLFATRGRAVPRSLSACRVPTFRAPPSDQALQSVSLVGADPFFGETAPRTSPVIMKNYDSMSGAPSFCRSFPPLTSSMVRESPHFFFMLEVFMTSTALHAAFSRPFSCPTVLASR